MDIAEVVASRSNCMRRHVAAVVVRDRHILSTGYNGTPHGVVNCFAGGCPRCAHTSKSGTHLEECLCVHAEQNAICQAACAKLIINSGIAEVVYGGDYAFLDAVKDLFHQAGVKYRKFKTTKGARKAK